MGANQKVAADVRATTPDTSARALASPRLESMKQVSDVRALMPTSARSSGSCAWSRGSA